MNTENILTSENRLKGVETRKKNLSPLFELNRFKQKRDRLENSKKKIELEIGILNKKIQESLCQFGVCDLVKSKKVSHNPKSNTLLSIINFLKEKTISLKCAEIAKGVGIHFYGNAYTMLKGHPDIFEQLPDKTWKLKS